MKKKKQTTTEPQGPAKKPYAPPSLVEYGSIAKLTNAGGTIGADAMSMMMVCL